MARKRKAARVREVADNGTPETRRRVQPDPLLSRHMENHRAAAGYALREALEEGIGARGFDLVRIGMGGGAKSNVHYVPLPQEHLMDARGWLVRWRRECVAAGIVHAVAEAVSVGASVREAGVMLGIPKSTAQRHADRGLDLYADMRGYRRRAISTGTGG